MKEIVRKKELEDIYERILARENIQIIGQAGSGKSHLQAELSKRLKGRRIIFTLNFTGIYQFSELVFKIRSCFEGAGNQNAGLDYQMRRLHQEHPAHRIQNVKSLFDYLKDLMNVLFQAGQDVVLCLEDPEFCELDELPLDELLKQFQKMSTAVNIQLLVISEQAFLKSGEQIALLAPMPEAIWDSYGEEELNLLAYSKGNLSFLKALMLSVKEHQGFDANLFFKAHHDYFFMLKSRFTSLQWRLLRALALDEQVEQPHAFDFLVQHNLGAASSVERALRNLLDSGFILRTEEAYQIKNPLLHRWLQHLYFQKGLASNSN